MIRLYGVVRRVAGGIRAGPVCRRQTPGREALTSPAACSSGTLVPIGTSMARSSLSPSLSLSSHSPNHSLFSLSSSYRRQHSSSSPLSPASPLEGRETYVPLSREEDWSVDIKHNESQKFKLDEGTHLIITQVSMVQEVKNGGKGVVGDFSVCLNVSISDDDDGVEIILATLSSEHASEEVDDVFLSEGLTVELSHGWKEGTVQFRGFMIKFPRWDKECGDEESATSFRIPTTVTFADCIPVIEEGSSEWSVVVNPNERLKYTVEDDKFICINRVALVKNGGGGVVEEFNVYWNRINYDEKKLLAILSSEHAEQVVTSIRLGPAEVVEFFHGRRDVAGTVHIHGEMKTVAARKLQGGESPIDITRKLQGDESSEQVKNHVPRPPVPAKKANISKGGDSSSSSRRRQLTPPSSGATKQRKSAASKPTTEDCMAVVTCFPGFEVGSSGYRQALVHFFLNESARVDFMIQKTDDTSKMEFLKALIAAAKEKQKITN